MTVDDSQLTRPSLLLRIRNADDVAAWREFAEIYGPLIHGFARKQGLQDADAADLAQEVLYAVAGAIGRLNYDRQLGRFRGWLLTVARSKLSNQYARKKRQPQGSGDSAMHESLQSVPSNSDDEAYWDAEYERRLFEWAAERIRPGFQETTWQAFWLTAVDGKEVKAVSEQLGITVGAAYIAKSRVLARLKEQIQEIGER
ncbi:MAG: sigma-70 family RNA polymerase sigma factor [Planctomycetes bacterium]|nr:sigma-70 family RNA polymerase sigma factor [Planctomycetota bacterium]